MEKVAVIGADGQLGTDLMEVFGEQAEPITKEDIDVTRAKEVEKLREMDPDIVINTAGYVNVDRAEEEPDKAFEVNAAGALNVARVTEDIDARLVYISTNYVFDGVKESPYHEDDEPNPLNVYGASKYAGEILSRNYCRQSYVVRSASLFGKAGSKAEGGNIVDTMIELAEKEGRIKAIDDIITSPTYTKDLAGGIKNLLSSGAEPGTHHITNKGGCSWYRFAQKIFEYVDLDPDIEPVKSEEFGRRAERPSFSALSCDKIGEIGINIRGWEEALKMYLKEKGHL